MTAVEWLFEQVWITSGEDLPELLEQAKEMEKQQKGYSEEDMLKSFMAGIKCESNNGKNFEQWFNEFKKK